MRLAPAQDSQSIDKKLEISALSGDVRLITLYSVPKKSTVPNEDRVSWSECGAVAAVADGASISYDSARWAEILVERYLNNPVVNQTWVNQAAKQYANETDRDSLPWMKQAAYDKGSFSTLLGIKFDLERSSITLTAFGDTNAFLLLDGHLTTTFPITAIEKFDQSPDLISTNMAENSYINDNILELSQKTITLTDCTEAILVIATDALAHWIMDSSDNRIKELLGIKNLSTFTQLVFQERENKSLKIDDTTLIAIRYQRVLPTIS